MSVPAGDLSAGKTRFHAATGRGVRVGAAACSARIPATQVARSLWARRRHAPRRRTNAHRNGAHFRVLLWNLRYALRVTSASRCGVMSLPSSRGKTKGGDCRDNQHPVDDARVDPVQRDLSACHGHTQLQNKPTRRRRTETATDTGRVFRLPSRSGARRPNHDVELEDVRVPALPRQFQDR